MKTEFYESAVQLGFYGVDRSGLTGKKDNVRKYWEDISIKLTLRPVIEKILERKKRIRVVDLGCGGGEGVELLTHIPVKDHVGSVDRDFVLSPGDIEEYRGLDISASMIEQGKRNYSGVPNIIFEQRDLSGGLPAPDGEPYDLYFSSYASLSHLTYAELLHLTEQIISRVRGHGFFVYDLLGIYSPEWPVYWDKHAGLKLPYNMAYLHQDGESVSGAYNDFQCSFWSPGEIRGLVEQAAAHGRKNVVIEMSDRSMFVGRHMDTGIFNKSKKRYRYQVNRLFDRDFRGVLDDLTVDLDFIHDYEKNLSGPAREKLTRYMIQWNLVISFIRALSDSDTGLMNDVLQNAAPSLKEDLDMLSWLYRNASRFPVMDFWASIMGPQIACVLRNCELNYQDAAGCGHGLFCIAGIVD